MVGPEGTQQYKYDVALSFLQRDEPLATKLADLLAGRLITFLYSRQQEEIAGTDGEQSFNRVFGSDARVVVVLYREEWGKTRFTRIEETAIRNRSYEEGYDFALFLPLDTPPTVPKWLPRSRLWIGLERWGIDAAAAVIEARVQEFGGAPRAETAVESAARLARDLADAKRRKAFLQSDNGLTSATAEVGRVIDSLHDIADASHDLRIEFDEDRRNYRCAIRAAGLSTTVAFANSYSGTTEYARLIIKSWDGNASVTARTYDERELSTRKFHFDIDQSDRNGWRESADQQFFSSPELADWIVRHLVERVRDGQLPSNRRPQMFILGAPGDDD